MTNEIKYQITNVILVLVLVIFAFYSGFKFNDIKENYDNSKKIVQIIQKVGPAGVIEQEDITKLDSGIKIELQNYKIIGVDQVNGMSMLPFMDDKSIMIGIEDYEFEELKLGDIIVYEAEGHTVSHAIIGKNIDANGTYLLLKGWNNYNVDRVKVREDNVLFKITGVLYGA